MARTFNRRKRMQALSEMNVTPLIDLSMALLIIFLIATPLLDQQTIPVNLPLESPRTQQDRPPLYQTITIDADGRLFWGEEEVDRAELTRRLGVLGADPDPPVLEIRGDATLQYQQVISLIDLIKRNNLSRISLGTRTR